MAVNGFKSYIGALLGILLPSRSKSVWMACLSSRQLSTSNIFGLAFCEAGVLGWFFPPETNFNGNPKVGYLNIYFGDYSILFASKIPILIPFAVRFCLYCSRRMLFVLLGLLRIIYPFHTLEHWPKFPKWYRWPSLLTPRPSFFTSSISYYS